MARNDGLFYRICKRSFDIVFSSCACIVLAVPVAFVCAIIAAESKCSPVYAQERIGRAGKVIRVIKLRSMVSDADNVEKYLDSTQLEQWQKERKVDSDPRITHVGRVLRATSLDEVPQFINVIKGDLSVIGPRPITAGELAWFGDDADEYLSVPMGITGLWQSSKRNGATFESGERQAIELEYVRNRGFAMDARVFAATFGAMFGKNATGR